MSQEHRKFGYHEVDDFLRGEHPKNLSIEDAESLGQGMRLDYRRESGEKKKEKQKFFSVKVGDHVALRSYYLLSFLKKGMENIFEVTSIKTHEDGRRQYTVRNIANPEKSFEWWSNFVKKIKTE